MAGDADRVLGLRGDFVELATADALGCGPAVEGSVGKTKSRLRASRAFLVSAVVLRVKSLLSSASRSVLCAPVGGGWCFCDWSELGRPRCSCRVL